MKIFEVWWNEKHPDDKVPEGMIGWFWFLERRLPMVVECSQCETTMALPNAIIDEDGNAFCHCCVDYEED